MTALLTTLGHPRIEGLSAPSVSTFPAVTKKDHGGSFKHQLAKAGHDRSRDEIRQKDDRGPEKPHLSETRDGLDAPRQKPAATESSTNVHDQRSSEDRAASSDGPGRAATGNDPEQAPVAVNSAHSTAQETTVGAQGLPSAGADPTEGVRLNPEILAAAQLLRAGDKPDRSAESPSIQLQASSHRTTARPEGEILPPLEVLRLQAEAIRAAQSGSTNPSASPSIETHDAGADSGAARAVAGSTTTSRAVESASAHASAPQTVNSAPGANGASGPALIDAVPAHSAADQQTSGQSRDGRDQRNSNAPITAPVNGTAAEGRALQLDTALKLEQTTGQPAVTELGARTTGSAPVHANQPGTVTGLSGEVRLAAVESTDPADGSRFANRIVRGLSAMINQHGGVMSMRLDPPDLGELRIQMTLSRGMVSADFQASSQQAHDLINKHLSTLRSALESQGMTVERLHVQTPGSSQNRETSEESGRERSQGEQRGERDARRQQDNSQTPDQRHEPREIDPATWFAGGKGARTA